MTTRWEIKPIFRDTRDLYITLMTHGFEIPDNGEMFMYKGKWGCFPSVVNLSRYKFRGVKNLLHLDVQSN